MKITIIDQLTGKSYLGVDEQGHHNYSNNANDAKQYISKQDAELEIIIFDLTVGQSFLPLVNVDYTD